MRKIGIGITSYNRPEHLALCVKQIAQYTKEYTIHIAKNIPNIAQAKNECLHALKDCDYIFLFDDDCFPIKEGWAEYFIDSGYQHLLYLTERYNKTGEINNGEAFTYSDCGGCFLFLTKEAFQWAGYFNSAYKQYGFEHAGYSKRLGWMASIDGGSQDFISLPKTSEYIYSLDYQGEGSYGIKHRGSITDLKAQAESIEYNRSIYLNEINGDKIFYSYENNI